MGPRAGCSGVPPVLLVGGRWASVLGGFTMFGGKVTVCVGGRVVALRAGWAVCAGFCLGRDGGRSLAVQGVLRVAGGRW